MERRTVGRQIKKEFAAEIGSSVDEFLEAVYMAGADLSGTKIESRARSIERSRKMLALLSQALNFMRKKHKYGESYYWILYYTYFSPTQYENLTNLMEQLRPYTEDCSRSTYYRKRHNAIKVLGSILWGYSSRECLKILDEFFPLSD